MSIDEYFASNYHEARSRFLAASRLSGASTFSYLFSDCKGVDGEELSTDVSVIGTDHCECDSVFLLVSGTHGVEGLCGSGCQVGFLRDRLHDAFSETTRVILVHGLNPYGFSWLRRTNECNVDVNRNFQDFSRALPSSDAYEQWHPLLVPDDWDGPSRRNADKSLLTRIQETGLLAFQSAVQGGQYTCADGLFFGGTSPSWSSLTFRNILASYVPSGVRSIVCFDLHTGLGALGYGEPIAMGSPQAINRARTLLGHEVKALAPSTEAQESASAMVTGSMLETVEHTFVDAKVTLIALEFGTVPILDVLTALRADNWLHNGHIDSSPLRSVIKQQIRDAFFVDKPYWKAAVYGRTADLVLRSARCLRNL